MSATNQPILYTLTWETDRLMICVDVRVARRPRLYRSTYVRLMCVCVGTFPGPAIHLDCLIVHSTKKTQEENLIGVSLRRVSSADVRDFWMWTKKKRDEPSETNNLNIDADMKREKQKQKLNEDIKRIRTTYCKTAWNHVLMGIQLVLLWCCLIGSRKWASWLDRQDVCWWSSLWKADKIAYSMQCPLSCIKVSREMRVNLKQEVRPSTLMAVK